MATSIISYPQMTMRHNSATPPGRRITLKEARQIVKSLGCSLRKIDDEYRVNFLGGTEETAYYTDDLEDAVNTAKRMRDEER